jgi:glutaminase
MEGITRLEILGVDLNQGDYDKRTPLHLAVAGGHFDIVQFLIKKKIFINPVDRWGATPLDDAKTEEIVNFL